MENAHTPDPYEAVLADLRAQRVRIDQAIATLEAVRGGRAPPRTDSSHIGGAATPKPPVTKSDLGPGAFLSLSIPEATKKLLAARRQQMRTADIVVELERGGLVLTSADKLNTVGSILLRRFNVTGDIVRVARGVWGLQEWYPGRKFATSKTKADDAPKDVEAEQEGPSGGNEADTQPDETGEGYNFDMNAAVDLRQI